MSLNETLIAAVQNRQALYDKTDDNYSNRVFIAKQWQEIGKEIGIDDTMEWNDIVDVFDDLIEDADEEIVNGDEEVTEEVDETESDEAVLDGLGGLDAMNMSVETLTIVDANIIRPYSTAEISEGLTTVLLKWMAMITDGITNNAVISHMISMAIIMAVADLVLQFTIERWQRRRRRQPWLYSSPRTKRCLKMGLVMGLFSHFWYLELDMLFPLYHLSHVVTKILLDLFFAGPAFVSLYIVGTSFLEGLTWEDIRREWQNQFLIIYHTNLMFWPIAQVFNFFLVPGAYRIFFVNMASLCWNVILSYLKHSYMRNPGETRPPSPAESGWIN